MASPLYDAVSVKHSRNIGDYVAAASSDGVRWSSVQRDVHLNEAIRRWMQKQIKIQITSPTYKTILKDPFALVNYLGGMASALGSGVVALTSYTGGIQWILSGYNSTTSKHLDFILPDMQGTFASGENSYLNGNYAFITGTNLTVKGAVNTDQIYLYYVKPHTNMAAGAGSDWLVPTQYEDQILKLALAVALTEYPTQENVQRAQFAETVVDKS
jgi:hypothetical protein